MTDQQQIFNSKFYLNFCKKFSYIFYINLDD